MWLVNAIEYQTSCYYIRQDLYDKYKWHTIRDNVFKTLWNGQNQKLQKDLIDRIKSLYKDDSVLLNCVTGGKGKNSLRTLVSNKLTEEKIQFVEINHPSSWHYKYGEQRK